MTQGPSHGLRLYGLHPALGLSKASSALCLHWVSPSVISSKGSFLREHHEAYSKQVRGLEGTHAQDFHGSGRAPWALASLSLVTARVEVAGTAPQLLQNKLKQSLSVSPSAKLSEEQ